VTRVRPLVRRAIPRSSKGSCPGSGSPGRLIVVSKAWPRMCDGEGARFPYPDDQARGGLMPTAAAHYPTTHDDPLLRSTLGVDPTRAEQSPAKVLTNFSSGSSPFQSYAIYAESREYVIHGPTYEETS
jgi:hypothetical protein